MNEIKKIFPYISPHKGKIAIVIFMGLLMSACDTSIAMIIKPLFEEVFEKKNDDLKITLCLAIIGIYLIHGIARYTHMFLLKMTAEFACAKIREDLQKKFMALSLTYHSNNPPGVLLSKTLNDISYIQNGLHKIADAIREPIAALLLIGWIFYLDWKLTLIIFIAAPLIVIFLKQISRSTRKYSHKQHEASEALTTTFKETLDGIRIIQSFNLEKETSKRLIGNIDKYLAMRKKIIALEESSGPITEQIGAITFAAVLFYKASAVIQGESTTGDFVSYLAALGFLQKPIKNLQDSYIRIQIMIAAIVRVFDVFKDPQVVLEREAPKKFPVNFNEIEFKNISFEYDPKSPLLKNVSLKVKKGQIVALVGESGSGKSTLVNLLERFYDPTSGSILIDGININDIELKDLRKHIALVTQDVFLFDDTLYNNIRSGNFEEEALKVEDAATLANASDFINRTPDKFSSRAGDRGTRFSGGEKQRISIARAIYKNAPILILDEATSALDSTSELEVQKGLEQLMKGKTVFVIAHRLSTIVGADRILVLKNGQIVEEGTHQDLLSRKGEYFSFYQLQSIQ